LRRTVDLSWAAGGIRTGDARLCRDGTGGRNHRGTALIHVIELLTVLRRFPLILELGCHGRSSRAAEGGNLGGTGTHIEAASAAVIGDTAVIGDYDCAVVDVGDVDHVNAVDGAVVVEVVAVPITAIVAVAGVAEAVVDAAIEADMQAPVAAIESPAVVVPAPISGRPESSVVRRSAPRSWDPVITGRSPAPVTGSPEIVGCRRLRLIVFRQRRRRLIGIIDGLGLALRV
jgi:hypothetical protein